MKTLIIGANGKIGRRLTGKLVGDGLPVRAMVRGAEQHAGLRDLGADVVAGDLEGEFETALDGCDAVVFAAGSGGHTGPDKTFTVDLWGAIKSIRACEELGVKRYIMVSARNAGDPDNGPASRRPYLIAKHLADDALMRSALDYTILRPGKLTEDPGTGLIRTTRPDPDEQFISRDDVAATIAYCLGEAATSNLVTQIYQGDAPIAQALARA